VKAVELRRMAKRSEDAERERKLLALADQYEESAETSEADRGDR
jgi:hypothetical protein